MKPRMESPRKTRCAREVLVLVLYSLVAVFYTYPLCIRFRDHVPGAFRDVWHHLWRHWYVSFSLFELHRLPYHTDLVSYPVGQTLAAGDFNVFVEACFALLLRCFDLAVSYNLFLFFSFVLTAYAGHLLACCVYGDRQSAFLCGLVFAFNPTMAALMHGGWVQHMFGVWVPLYVLTLYRLRADSGGMTIGPTAAAGGVPQRSPASQALARRARCIRRVRVHMPILISALVLVLAMLTSLYNGVALALLSVVFMCFTLAQTRSLRFVARWAQSFVIAAIVSAAAMTPRIREELYYPAPVPPPASTDSADLAYTFLPCETPFYDSWHPSSRQYVSTYCGWTVLALFCLGFVFGREKRLFWILAALLFFALSLGPYLKIFGATELDILGRKTRFVLPWRILHEIPPFYRLPNHFRFHLVAMLAVGMAIVPPVSLMLARMRRPLIRGLAIAALGALMLAEYVFAHAIPFPRDLMSARAPLLYENIRDESGEFAVADLPLGIYGKSLFYQTVHHKKVLFPSPERTRRAEAPYMLPIVDILSVKGPDEDRFRNGLKLLRVKYIIVHSDFINVPGLDETVRRRLGELFGSPAYQDANAAAYRTYPDQTFSREDEARTLQELARLSYRYCEYELAKERMDKAVELSAAAPGR